MSETTFIEITITNWVMIFAVIAGPILAVQIQKYIEGKREAKERKIRVFKDLMSTRASTLAHQHVVAINLVGLEFQGKEFSKVVNAWKTYLDHLGSYPNDDESMAKIWGEKRNDQLSDLLYEMGISLGFEFDKVHIKKAGYIPKGYTDREEEQTFIRHAVADLLLGKRDLPMKVTSFPMDQNAVDAQMQLQKAIAEHYASGKPFPVKIVDGKD